MTTRSSLASDERLVLDVVEALRGADNLRERLLTARQSGTPAVADIAYDDGRRDRPLGGTPAFREVRNTTGGCDRPAYRFGTSSVLKAQLATSGPSIPPAVDAAIRSKAVADATTFP